MQFFAVSPEGYMRAKEFSPEELDRWSAASPRDEALLRLIHEYMAGLDDQRAAIVDGLRNGKTIKEIAGETGKSERTIHYKIREIEEECFRRLGGTTYQRQEGDEL